MEDETIQELEAAHKSLSRDPSFQQELPVLEIKPEKQPDTIGWLDALFDAIGAFFNALVPLFKVLLFGGAALLIGYILYSVGKAFYDRREQMKALLNRKAPDDSLKNVEIRPDEVFARNLLDEADKLAGEGRYGEAIRLLLHSSIRDMQERVHRKIGVSLTAREIGRLGDMPDKSRTALHDIIHTVEINVFAGQDVGKAEYDKTRGDYQIFAFRDKSA